jgi:hypothetical protein
MTDHVKAIPIRQKSTGGQPPARPFMRRCHRCSADFLGLAAGKTGERGLWHEGRWYCSQECYDAHHREEVEVAAE